MPRRRLAWSAELVIGGDLLARGYFDRPDLTAERFMPEPFSQSGSRLLPHRDLARYAPDGVIEVRRPDRPSGEDSRVPYRVGRNRSPDCSSTTWCETPWSSPNRPPAVLQLVGYVVPEATAMPRAELRQSIKASLAAVLPDYMRPGLT